MVRTISVHFDHSYYNNCKYITLFLINYCAISTVVLIIDKIVKKDANAYIESLHSDRKDSRQTRKTGFCFH